MTDLNLIIIGTKKQLQQRPPPPPSREPVWFYELGIMGDSEYWDVYWENVDLFYREFYGSDNNFFSSYPDFEEDFD
jgi:hypothetical protein